MGISQYYNVQINSSFLPYKISQFLYLNSYKVTKFCIMVPVIFLLFLLICTVDSFSYNKTFTTQGHSAFVTTASFFADGQRFVTGGNDNVTKIWSLTNFSLLHTYTYSDLVMNVCLHPFDNRIFVVVYDGSISVYDPNNYTLLTSFTHPAGNGNYMVFNPNGTKFYLGGFDGLGSQPVIYIYDAANYSLLDSITTTLPIGDQINTMSIDGLGQNIAVCNLAFNITTYKIEIYDLRNENLIADLSNSSDRINWAIFNEQYLCATSKDQNTRCYRPFNNTYVLDKSWNNIDYPYCLGYGIPQTIIVTVNKSIVFYTNTSTPTSYLNYTDVDYIFVFDNTLNMSHLVTGMQSGNISIWQYVPDPISPLPPVVPSNPQTTVNNLGLIIGLSVGIPLLILLLVLVFCCCFKRKLKINLSNNDLLNVQNQINEQYIVIKDDQNKSNASSDVDYDQLMAEGTIIVIKDEDKKQKYIKKIKNKKRNDGDLENTFYGLNSLEVKGNIIIIRDKFHAQKIKQKSNSKIVNYNDDDEDIDYDQLMAEGSIIIIKDEQTKQRLNKKLQQIGNNTQKQNYSQIFAKGTTVIITGDDLQKKYLKEIKKQQAIKNTKHDKILANGDIMIISQGNKKKQFVQDLKKQLQKNNNNNKNIGGLQAAQQIIIIQGDDDFQESMTYQQIMAEGTVIVIKDDDVIKQYASHIHKQKKKKSKNRIKSGNLDVQSNKSSEVDYQMLMAQQCVIVIKEEGDKQEYVNFLKKRKNKSDRSSNINYEQLMNSNNVMMIQDNTNKNKAKSGSQGAIRPSVNSYNNLKAQDPFLQLMAEKNVVVIDQNLQAQNNQKQM